jgi:hypothetical protein
LAEGRKFKRSRTVGHKGSVMGTVIDGISTASPRLP